MIMSAGHLKDSNPLKGQLLRVLLFLRVYQLEMRENEHNLATVQYLQPQTEHGVDLHFVLHLYNTQKKVNVKTNY